MSGVAIRHSVTSKKIFKEELQWLIESLKSVLSAVLAQQSAPLRLSPRATRPMLSIPIPASPAATVRQYAP